MNILILHLSRAFTKTRQHNPAGKLKRRRGGGGICSHLGSFNPTEEGSSVFPSNVLTYCLGTLKDEMRFATNSLGFNVEKLKRLKVPEGHTVASSCFVHEIKMQVWV